MTTRRVLIVDDDDVARSLLQELLEKEGYHATLAKSGEEALKLSKTTSFELVVSDIRMLDLDGIDVLRHFKREHPRSVVILMTAFGSMETAIEAIKEGAFDYISKPFQIEAFQAVLRKASKQIDLLHSPESLVTGTPLRTAEIGVIAGSSAKMLDIFKTVGLAALSQATVLITGESGTGKELIARAIHDNSSQRRSHKFIAVNCGALTDTLLESELFGHTRGSFTGATENRRGLFEEAHGGTLFLDEIGDVSPAMQVKLLRVLQEGEIRPVGSNDSKKIDVRIIAATHRNLQKLVADGAFREDLYYRLKVISLEVPPLRERIDDIPELVNHFLPLYAKRNSKRVSHLTTDAMKALMKYHWPGNVRELQNAIERAVAMVRTSQIDTDDLPAEILQTTTLTVTAAPSDGARTSLDEVERRHILQVLQQTQYNKTKAAEILGIDRATLYRKAQKFGIDLRITTE